MERYIGTKGIILDILNDEPKYKVKLDLDNDFLVFQQRRLGKGGEHG